MFGVMVNIFCEKRKQAVVQYLVCACMKIFGKQTFAYRRKYNSILSLQFTMIQNELFGNNFNFQFLYHIIYGSFCCFYISPTKKIS